MVLDDSEQCSLSDILLKNARVIDPSQGIDGLRDIAIKDGKIEAVGKHIAFDRRFYGNETTVGD